MNRKLLLFLLFTIFVSFIFYNSSLSQVINNFEKAFQEKYINKIIPNELYNLTSEKIENKKSVLIIYIPSKTCFNCLESLFEKLKKKE